MLDNKVLAYTVKVTVRNEERKLTQEFLLYQDITLSRNDPTLVKMVDEVIKAFGDEIEDVKVTIKIIW